MKWLFWISALLVAYPYFLYPAWLYVKSRMRPRPVQRGAIVPSVSIVIAVHNEARVLPHKLQNIFSLDYPSDKYEVIVVSDGSDDDTNEILRSQRDGRFHCVIAAENRGKANALNLGVQQARGEIVVFTDARQTLQPDALRRIVENFADPTVGCVSGELMFRSKTGSSGGVSLYWRLEKLIRKLEASTGSVVGATGAIYGVRRSLIPPIPEGTLLDDVYIPLHVVRQSYRVVFEPSAVAWDEEPQADRQEFRRKVRTLAGNYQLVQLSPWLLWSPHRLWGRFISHKLLRLLVPFLLMLNFAAAWVLHREPFYFSFAVLETVSYSLALLGVLSGHSKLSKLTSAPAAFCVLNAAAAAALFGFLRHRRAPTRIWKTAETASKQPAPLQEAGSGLRRP